jgi:hypothetical protein
MGAKGGNYSRLQIVSILKRLEIKFLGFKFFLGKKRVPIS